MQYDVAITFYHVILLITVIGVEHSSVPVVTAPVIRNNQVLSNGYDLRESYSQPISRIGTPLRTVVRRPHVHTRDAWSTRVRKLVDQLNEPELIPMIWSACHCCMVEVMFVNALSNLRSVYGEDEFVVGQLW